MREGGPYTVKTWHLFAVMLLLTLLTDWVYQTLASTSNIERLLLDATIDDLQFESQLLLVERAQAWSVLLAPLVLWLGVAFWAMTFQLGFALWNEDVRFARLFRVATVAHAFVLAHVVIDMWFRLQLPPFLVTAAVFYQTAGKLTDFISPNGFLSPLSPILGMVNIFELGWYAVMLYGLVEVAGRSMRRAAVVTIGVFVLFNTLQWAINAYLTKLLT